jgi:hypothetical protein
MKKALLLFASALIFSALSVLMVQTASVGATGAPTDNTTVPNVPAGDQAENEIKPPVEYVLRGPTSQTETTPPNLIAGFITAGNKVLTVSGNENWYLDLDINNPGWIYIYEYYPAGQALPGQWLAYKWQLPESGLWRLGPFTPADNEAEGQHMYRLWFYGDGQWAVGKSGTQSNLIYWTYSKGQPAEPVPPPSPVAPAKQPGFPARVYAFFTQPVVLGISLIIVAGLALLVIYIWRRRSQYKISRTGEASTAQLSATLASVPATAKITLPNGIDIRFSANSKVIGRSDLARALSLDDLGLISRQHFEVKSDDEKFYVEDLGSANGTLLNGQDISDQGPVSLDDDDIIEPAGAIPLKFHTL